jgi:hypothetical protein
MVDPDDIRWVYGGGFVRLTLCGGPTVSGHAASDPEDAKVLRLDGLASEGDGGMSQFSLRLQPGDIEAIEAIQSAPLYADPNGTDVAMPAAFWPDPLA